MKKIWNRKEVHEGDESNSQYLKVDGDDEPLRSPLLKKGVSVDIINDIVLPSNPGVEVEKLHDFSNLMEGFEFLCSQMMKIVNL